MVDPPKVSNGINVEKHPVMDGCHSDCAYPGQSRKVKQQIVDMALNGSGIRDTARVPHVSTNTNKELKKD